MEMCENSLPDDPPFAPGKKALSQGESPCSFSIGGYRPAAHWIAVSAAIFTLPLLYVGGTVTTYRVGLAVPDWPTTFGDNMFAYDFWNAPFGVRVEHTHRLYGAAVGLATILLCLWFLAFEPRRWLKGLGFLALVAVIVQGILGGTRVNQVSTLLAAIHGFTAQAFFGLIVALCVFTSRKWSTAAKPADDPAHLRWLAMAVLCAVALQIILGSWSRHFATLATIGMHAPLGAILWIAATIVLVKVERNRQAAWPLAASARALAVLTTLQVLLGALALFDLLPLDGIPRPTTFSEALVRTGHQTGGALILAACVVLCLRAHRHLAAPSCCESGRTTEEVGSVQGPLGGGLDWEAVA
jgi:cytochrome c oxidase assembly protein subunit 15